VEPKILGLGLAIRVSMFAKIRYKGFLVNLPSALWQGLELDIKFLQTYNKYGAYFLHF